MRDVSVVGAAMTNFGKHEKTGLELFVEASLGALEKSGLEPKDVEALFVGNCLGSYSDNQVHMASFIHSSIGLKTSAPALRLEAACATATVAIRNAALLVGSGVYDIVLVGGTEKVTGMSTSVATNLFSMALHAQYEIPTGITFPAVFAMAAHMYANKYNVNLAALKKYMAAVAVKNHTHGYKNSKAYLRKKITIDDVLDSPMVCDPLQLLDCCPFSDGASAIVIASSEKAKDLIKKPICIVGMGQASSGSLCVQKDLTRSISREVASKTAYAEAGITPFDVDVCELHDCFTIAEIIAIEGLGFCDFGRGYYAAEEEMSNVNANKKPAINTSGGLKSRGHPVGATGAAQVVEIVEQLRGESGTRQVDGAKIGLIDTMGGSFGTVCNLILKAKY